MVEEFREYVRASLSEIINDIANEKINSFKNELQLQNQENNNLNEDKIESESVNEINIEELEGVSYSSCDLF